MGNKFLLLLSAGILSCCLSIYAQTTINITPVKDNTLYEDVTGSLSNGAGDHIFVGATNLGLKRRGLLKFDIASNVPSGATILEATLTLSMDQTVSGPSNIELHNVLSDWGEGESIAAENGGIGVAAATNDVTWLHTFYKSSFWKTAGGDFSNEVSATTSVNGTGNYTWTSVQLVAVVQKWLDSPSSNFGWCLTGDESNPRTAKRFTSRETATPAKSPGLKIIYTILNSDIKINTDSKCLVYPNPSSGKVRLSVNNIPKAEVKIFNLLGRIVYSGTLINDKLNLDLTKEPEGIYFYELLTTNRIVDTGKIIINR